MAKKTAKSSETSNVVMPTRALPNNVDAERGVIGALLIDPQLCDDVSTIVRPNDFYLDQHRRIFSRLLAMRAESTGVDLTLLVESLRAAGELEEVGGEAYLAELMTSVQVVAHASYYAQIVAQNSMRRRLIESCEKILNDAYAPEVQPKELVAQAEERIFAINDERNVGQIVPMNSLLQDVFRYIDALANDDVNGVTTGFTDLDHMLGGLHGSELIILAARPSMGKTALAANIADHVAVNMRQPVLFFSLEMARTELALRILCARGRINSKKLRISLSNEDNTRFNKAASELSSAPLYIDDSPSRTVTEIGAVARRLKRQEGLGLIVIDYLGLIEPDNPLDPRQEQVAKIARRLKGLARELDVPVLCLAQLNRMTEMTKDNRPRLAHLRESGAIEQDADVVMFVHREEYYCTKQEVDDRNIKGVAEIIVAKQRNGPVGDVKLAWLSEFTLFANQAQGEDMGANYDEFYYDGQDGGFSEFDNFG
ncbi:MAG: replicative DNA helicase [Planctomycetia bacterium]|nr:replicative DNA helicase [Planctomycetia bacterium]